MSLLAPLCHVVKMALPELEVTGVLWCSGLHCSYVTAGTCMSNWLHEQSIACSLWSTLAGNLTIISIHFLIICLIAICLGCSGLVINSQNY